jgi:hypothetical protein
MWYSHRESQGEATEILKTKVVKLDQLLDAHGFVPADI